MLARTLPKSRVSRPKPHGSRLPNSRRAENRTSEPPQEHLRQPQPPIYPPTALRNTNKLRTIKPPPNPTPLKPSTGHFPHRLPEPRPAALDPAHVLAGGDVQPQLQIRKLGQDERARTRFRRGGKEAARCSPRLATRAPASRRPRVPPRAPSATATATAAPPLARRPEMARARAPRFPHSASSAI